ncbi:hypothetical protein C5167_032247 [Papaver somniferum]|uniref:RWD domain-containing protein n=1 Tax=Papaver somniferum TaxID=3469 RepID=A0A4Y7K809_PAPSO|nr:hypothetical protein C5167_032247 [Papaver somniferum]
MRLNSEVHDRKQDGLCCCGRDGSKKLVMDGSELKQMMEEDDEETSKVLLALVFAHTEKYPDEPPLLHVKSLKGISLEHLQALKQKLEEEASENLGMAMNLNCCVSHTK